MSAGPDPRGQAFTAASVPEHYERVLAPAVFEPWAEVLVDAAGVAAGDRVLDVASGTGVVARAAARRVGIRGHVLATDISGPMLRHAAGQPALDGAAAIEYQQAPATELPARDGAFDVVLCQQGLQFFSARSEAVREMARVLRSGGAVGAAVWAAGHRLEPFDDYAEALIAAGAEPPFPRAFENASFVMAPDVMRTLFDYAGLEVAELSVVELTVTFDDAASAAAGILGTPFGPLVEALAPENRAALDADLARRFAPALPGAQINRPTAAVVVRAIAP